MQERKKDKEDGLKEIVLSDDSNIILPEVSFPSTYHTQSDVKYGAKSNEQKLASEHDLLVYRQRVSRRDSTLTPEEIRNLVSETNERRRVLEQSIAEQKEEFQQKRAAELEERRTKQREEERARRIANENDTQRQMRIAVEEEVKTSRAKEIQTLENKRRREKEEVETFFLRSSNRFTQKYCNPITQKKISEETGIDRIISSRHFSGTYSNRYAHRCVLCGYHFPESLSISKIYQHIFENKDKHMQLAFNEIDKTYNVLIADTRKKHAAEDNPTFKQQRLSRELEGLSKLKGAKYR